MTARLALAALAAQLGGAGAGAQTAAAPRDAVVLGGWTLPVGTVVVQRSHSESTQDWDTSADPSGRHWTEHTTHDSVVERRIDAVGDHGPTRVTERFVEAGGDRWNTAGSLSTDREAYTDTRAGTAVVYTARGAGWSVAPADRPRGGVTKNETEDYIRPVGIDHAEYLWDRPIAVGETWAFGAELIGRGYRNLDPDRPQRLVFRLDSLGTWEGHPVAWLSYDMIVNQRGESWSSVQQMSGTITRCLDLFLDCVHTSEVVTETEGMRPNDAGPGTPYSGVNRDRFTAYLSVR